MANSASNRPLLIRLGSGALGIGVMALVYNILQIWPLVKDVQSFFYWLFNPAVTGGGIIRMMLIWGPIILIPLGIILLIVGFITSRGAMAAGAAAAGGMFGSSQQREWAQHQADQQAQNEWNAQQTAQQAPAGQWDANPAPQAPAADWQTSSAPQFGDAPAAPQFGDSPSAPQFGGDAPSAPNYNDPNSGR